MVANVAPPTCLKYPARPFARRVLQQARAELFRLLGLIADRTLPMAKKRIAGIGAEVTFHGRRMILRGVENLMMPIMPVETLLCLGDIGLRFGRRLLQLQFKPRSRRLEGLDFHGALRRNHEIVAPSVQVRTYHRGVWHHERHSSRDAVSGVTQIGPHVLHSSFHCQFFATPMRLHDASSNRAVQWMGAKTYSSKCRFTTNHASRLAQLA